MLRTRVRRDTEPEPLAWSSEAAVLRAMARNERQLEHVTNGLRDIGQAVTYQWRAVALGMAAMVAAVLIAAGGVIVAVAVTR